MKSTLKITVYYASVDHFTQSRTFKTLAGAQKYADKWVGPTPDLGSCYAVSHDGIGRIMVKGAAVADLFPALQTKPAADPERDPEAGQGADGDPDRGNWGEDYHDGRYY